MIYAPYGYAYYSVVTPGFFREELLPENPEFRTKEEELLWDELCEASEIHGTHISSLAYRSG